LTVAANAKNLDEALWHSLRSLDLRQSALHSRYTRD
jgi:hypothetical protein